MIKDYCNNYMDYNYDTYRELQSKDLKLIYDIDMFNGYKEIFPKSITAKNLKKKKFYISA